MKNDKNFDNNYIFILQLFWKQRTDLEEGFIQLNLVINDEYLLHIIDLINK